MLQSWAWTVIQDNQGESTQDAISFCRGEYLNQQFFSLESRNSNCNFTHSSKYSWLSKLADVVFRR